VSSCSSYGDQQPSGQVHTLLHTPSFYFCCMNTMLIKKVSIKYKKE
jgi:hypothetical protein